MEPAMREPASLDTLSPEDRSQRMPRARSRNTQPEMRACRVADALGFRNRLHAPDLPGRPEPKAPEGRSPSSDFRRPTLGQHTKVLIE
ncbi:MAG: hypothetical protein F4210_01055 [Holophagales bacterium]|nr:hypothetical protein [Holophagales bacterium]MYF94104.1 hypothetical protein [Holophagales bacterium]